MIETGQTGRPAENEGVFPWSLAEQVFDHIKSRHLRVLRYCDLSSSTLANPSKYRYIDEFVRFNGLRFGPVSAFRALGKLVLIRQGGGRPFFQKMADFLLKNDSAPAVILQHDADLLPDRTIEMMELESRYGLRSSNYFFARHAETDDYHPNFEKLQEFERAGFEIGYHQNAYERSDYDVKGALDIVAKDLAYLKRYFDIRSFVPHGGQSSTNGLNNDHLPHEGELRDLLWAYNGKCILKEHTWSDGGIRKWAPGDPREFVTRLPNGTRAMMLMHPQYYSDELREDWQKLPISKAKWWRQLWGI